MSEDLDRLPLANHAVELVAVPAGRFCMGSEHGLHLELPIHEVMVEQPFWIGRYPLTRAQWLAATGDDPALHRGSEQLPVEGVSFDAALDCCARLSELSGRRVRLPSEAEWEYACRAGSTTEFHFGNETSELSRHAWYDLNSTGRPHPVGTVLPNAWGLCDMIGNVWEWCLDVWQADYTGAPANASPRLDRAEQQPRRVLRGGSFRFDSDRCRSAYRSREWRHFATDEFGMRVVVETG